MVQSLGLATAPQGGMLPPPINVTFFGGAGGPVATLFAAGGQAPAMHMMSSGGGGNDPNQPPGFFDRIKSWFENIKSRISVARGDVGEILRVKLSAEGRIALDQNTVDRINKIKGTADPSKLGDFKGIQGMTADEIMSRIPSNWTKGVKSPLAGNFLI